MRDPVRILYFECFSGISGDMSLAAMIGLGVPLDHIESELRKLGAGGWRLRVSPASKAGIHGTRVDVDILPQTFSPKAGALVVRHGTHDHRSHRDIRSLIEKSQISPGAKTRALKIFASLAEAEAKIHGKSPEEVHFHEVGAIDSIVDIVGAAICLDYLAPDRIVCSRIELGGGFVKCQHGLIPVPAPAVVELLKGAPVRLGTVPFETTTPTGAAILAAMVDEFDETPCLSLRKTAYGIGHRDTEIPNVLRLSLAEGSLSRSDSPHAPPNSEEILLECNLDDMSPELLGHLFEVFLRAGAADIWVSPIVMKKNRPAHCLSVLCPAEKAPALAELLLRETSTFGYRRRTITKVSLDRATSTFASRHGPVRFKTAFLEGKTLKSKPEYEDLREASERTGRPLGELRDEVVYEYRRAQEGKA